jgi:hypothetical protein
VGTAGVARAAGSGEDRLRGKLIQTPGQPALRSSNGAVISLDGDKETIAVLLDSRLKNDDFEALGRPASPERFVVDPIYKRALFVYRGGKRLVITYWCEVCSIRSWSPGICACCQQETALDPRDPSLSDNDVSR